MYSLSTTRLFSEPYAYSASEISTYFADALSDLDQLDPDKQIQLVDISLHVIAAFSVDERLYSILSEKFLQSAELLLKNGYTREVSAFAGTISKFEQSQDNKEKINEIFVLIDKTYPPQKNILNQEVCAELDFDAVKTNLLRGLSTANDVNAQALLFKRLIIRYFQNLCACDCSNQFQVNKLLLEVANYLAHFVSFVRHNDLSNSAEKELVATHYAVILYLTYTNESQLVNALLGPKLAEDSSPIVVHCFVNQYLLIVNQLKYLEHHELASKAFIELLKYIRQYRLSITQPQSMQIVRLALVLTNSIVPKSIAIFNVSDFVQENFFQNQLQKSYQQWEKSFAQVPMIEMHNFMKCIEKELMQYFQQAWCAHYAEIGQLELEYEWRRLATHFMGPCDVLEYCLLVTNRSELSVVDQSYLQLLNRLFATDIIFLFQTPLVDINLPIECKPGIRLGVYSPLTQGLIFTNNAYKAALVRQADKMPDRNMPPFSTLLMAKTVFVSEKNSLTPITPSKIKFIELSMVEEPQRSAFFNVTQLQELQNAIGVLGEIDLSDCVKLCEGLLHFFKKPSDFVFSPKMDSLAHSAIESFRAEKQELVLFLTANYLYQQILDQRFHQKVITNSIVVKDKQENDFLLCLRAVMLPILSYILMQLSSKSLITIDEIFSEFDSIIDFLLSTEEVLNFRPEHWLSNQLLFRSIEMLNSQHKVNKKCLCVVNQLLEDDKTVREILLSAVNDMATRLLSNHFKNEAEIVALYEQFNHFYTKKSSDVKLQMAEMVKQFLEQIAVEQKVPFETLILLNSNKIHPDVFYGMVWYLYSVVRTINIEFFPQQLEDIFMVFMRLPSHDYRETFLKLIENLAPNSILKSHVRQFWEDCPLKNGDRILMKILYTDTVAYLSSQMDNSTSSSEPAVVHFIMTLLTYNGVQFKKDNYPLTNQTVVEQLVAHQRESSRFSMQSLSEKSDVLESIQLTITDEAMSVLAYEYLCFQVFGQCTTLSQVFYCQQAEYSQVFSGVISLGVQLTTCSANLNNANLLNRISQASYTKQLLRVLFFNPQFDLSEHYVFHEKKNGEVLILHVNKKNLLAMHGEQIVFMGNHVSQSILFCMDQVSQALDLQVLRQFISLDACAVVQLWLEFCQSIEEFLENTIDSQIELSRQNLQKKICLNKEFIKLLRDRFSLLQHIVHSLLDQSRTHITGQDILQGVYAAKAKYCLQLFTEYPSVDSSSVQARMKALSLKPLTMLDKITRPGRIRRLLQPGSRVSFDGAAFNETFTSLPIDRLFQSDHQHAGPQSLTFTVAIDFNREFTNAPINIDWLATNASNSEVIKELLERPQVTQALVIHLLCQRVKTFPTHYTAAQKKELLRLICCVSLQVLDLQGFYDVLDAEILKIIVLKTGFHLTYLDLSKAICDFSLKVEGAQSLLDLIAETTENLKELLLDDIRSLTVFLVKNTFPELERLSLQRCENLQSVEVNAPFLKTLVVSGCLRLSIIQGCFTLEKFQAENCPQLMNSALLESMPQYVNLLANDEFFTDKFKRFCSKIALNQCVESDAKKIISKPIHCEILNAALSINTSLRSLSLQSNDLSEILKNLQKSLCCVPLTSLDLSWTRINNPSALALLANIMQVNTTLTSLDLSNNQPAESAGHPLLFNMLFDAIFEYHTILKKLSLANNQLGPSLTYFFSRFGRLSLTALDVSYVGLDMNSVGAFQSSLEQGSAPICQSLRSLVLQSNPCVNQMDAQFALIFTQLKRLQSLNLHDNSLSERSSVVVINSLKQRSSLLHLDLSKNSLKNSTKPLADLISFYTTQLVELVLSDCLIEDKGIAQLSMVLKHIVNLQILNVANNQFKINGLKALASGIERNASLTALDLSERQLTNKYNKAAGRSSSELTGVAVLAKLIGKQAINTALPNWQEVPKSALYLKLRFLNMKGLIVNPEGMQALSTAIEGNPNMEQLNVSSEFAGQKNTLYWQAIVGVLERNKLAHNSDQSVRHDSCYIPK